MQNSNIIYKRIDELKPYPNNARKHSKKQIRQIARSLREFGFVNPVITDADGNVIAGHGRIEGAKLEGIDLIPVVCITHMTPEQIRAYRLADNKLAELAGWDEDILKIEFQNLVDIDDIDLTITGFEMAEIDKILLDANALEDDGAEDVSALFKSTPVSLAGDLWALGDHLLLCGDARNKEDYARLMGDDLAQLIFTDPPYNVRVKDIMGLGKAQHDEFAMASGEMSQEEFTAFLIAVLILMAAFSADGSIHYICIDWRHLAEMLAAGKTVYSEPLNLCIWNKTNGGMGSLYRSKHEEIFVFKKGKAPHINNVQLGSHGRYRTNVWDYAGQNTFHAGRKDNLSAHPTVKPIRLVADALLDCSHQNGIVLDPFGGSGTTLLAAEKTGRRARLIELEPTYVDVTIRRWQKLTGKDAVLSTTGKTFNEIEKEKNHDGE